MEPIVSAISTNGHYTSDDLLCEFAKLVRLVDSFKKDDESVNMNGYQKIDEICSNLNRILLKIFTGNITSDDRANILITMLLQFLRFYTIKNNKTITSGKNFLSLAQSLENELEEFQFRDSNQNTSDYFDWLLMALSKDNLLNLCLDRVFFKGKTTLMISFITIVTTIISTSTRPFF